MKNSQQKPLSEKEDLIVTSKVFYKEDVKEAVKMLKEKEKLVGFDIFENGLKVRRFRKVVLVDDIDKIFGEELTK